MQKADEDQLLNGMDRMLFSCIKYKERIRPTGMLNAIAAGKNTLSFQNHHKKWRTGRIVLSDRLLRFECEKDRTSLPVNMEWFSAGVLISKL